MLEAGYIVLTLVMGIAVLIGYHKILNKIEENPAEGRKKMRNGILIFGAWMIYLLIMGKSSFLQNYELPPRFPIFLILPAFLFIAFFLYRNRNSKMFSSIPRSWLVYIQSFRILVEMLFVGTVAKGILHPEVTIEGYNYDMVFGASALVVGFLVFNLKMFSEKLALYWNYLGLAVLISIIYLFTTTVFVPSLWGSETSLASYEFASYPYVLVPGFLMPLAVFLHLFSIIQLKKSFNLNPDPNVKGGQRVGDSKLSIL